MWDAKGCLLPGAGLPWTARYAGRTVPAVAVYEVHAMCRGGGGRRRQKRLPAWVLTRDLKMTVVLLPITVALFQLSYREGET